MADKTLAKVKRLIILREAHQRGLTQDKTLQQIADVFGVNRSAILRDFRDLDEIAEVEDDLLAQIEEWSVENKLADLETDVGLRNITVQQACAALRKFRETHNRGPKPKVPDDETLRQTYDARGYRMGTYAQIAQAAGVSEAVLKQRLRRIRERLQMLLAERT